MTDDHSNTVNMPLSNRYCPEGMPVEEWQEALRRQMAEKGFFKVEHVDNNLIWGDYVVHSGRNRYRVAFRGVRSDQNYCSCLDFRTNGLGTCKHVEAVSLHLQETVPGYPWDNHEFNPTYSSIYINYKGGRKVMLFLGSDNRDEYVTWARKYFGENGTLPDDNFHLIDQITEEARGINSDFKCYDDVYDMIDNTLKLMQWCERVEYTLPAERLDCGIAETLPQVAQEELYNWVHTGNAIVVGNADMAFKIKMSAVMDYINQQRHGRIMIIVPDKDQENAWLQMLKIYLPNAANIEIYNKNDFVDSSNKIVGLYSMVFVQGGSILSDWKNVVSTTIKRIAISHLFIQLDAISDLTPIQFSSISQHISPYVLGPLYLFIRDYRPIFPLTNDGSNLPDVASAFTFIDNRESSNLIVEEQTEKMVNSLTPLSEKNRELLMQTIELLENPERCINMAQLIRSVLGK